jgi:hypothetical protein
MKALLLDTLKVLHLLKDSRAQSSTLHLVPGSFRLDTCQRWAEVFTSSDSTLQSDVDGIEVYSGHYAYSFLLRLASGLESEVIGETNVFGQVKKAWSDYEAKSGALLGELRPVFRKLFEDTKDIRSAYLRNLGSSSYGGLVRHILRQRESAGPLLLVGAGDMAVSVCPWLMDHELLLWNRSEQALQQLASLLEKKPGARFRVVTGIEEENAWRTAPNAVVCIPVNSDGDSRRTALWREGPTGRSLIHLGCRRGQSSEWETIPNFFSLDDIFDLQKTQGQACLDQVARARTACDEKAALHVTESRAPRPQREQHAVSVN